MSLGQFIMAGAWLLSPGLYERLKQTVRQPAYWLITGIFLIHLLGLWNTEDFSYAWRDLRIKLPLLLMPLLFAAGPEITVTQYRTIFLALLTGVLLSTGTGYVIRLLDVQEGVNDFRDYSYFISHIRLSLLIDFCLAWCATRPLMEGRKTVLLRILLISWLTGYLLLIQSITGFLILGLLLLTGLAARYHAQPTPRLRNVLTVFLLLALLSGGGVCYHLFINSIRPAHFQPYPPQQRTARGGTYETNFNRQDIEDGKLVWENYCITELNEAFMARTGKNIWQEDVRKQMLQVTLLRYLTAKGFSKDYEGVMRLSKEDVENILLGYPTPDHRNRRHHPLQRLNDLAAEYRIWHYSGWANGQSMVLRFEFFKTAGWMIAQHPLTGVGTGDLPTAWKVAYEQTGSTLEEKWRLRAHNQFLTFGIAFGIAGIIYLLLVLTYFFRMAWQRGHLLLLFFMVIATVSFLGEDTLETQAGVTFFAFLLSWLWRYEAQDAVTAEGTTADSNN